MAWEGSTRRVRLPPNWHTLRRAVIRKYDGKCAVCSEAANEVDHILQGDDHSLANLQLLCREHHVRKTNDENFSRRAKKMALRKRPTEGHPGVS
jgi:5-methylcytosine-specific restriction endonuclease McrA